MWTYPPYPITCSSGSLSAPRIAAAKFRPEPTSSGLFFGRLPVLPLEKIFSLACRHRLTIRRGTAEAVSGSVLPGAASFDGKARQQNMTLLDQDWTEPQAQGLLDKLNLDGGTPKWKLEHLKRLRDWCSAHGVDATTIDSQLEFVAYELCHGFQAVGMALKQAQSVEEARKVVEPYIRRLSVKKRRVRRKTVNRFHDRPTPEISCQGEDVPSLILSTNPSGL